MNLINRINTPLYLGIIYAVIVLVFSVIYWFFFSLDFKNVEPLNLVQSLYFSIVTATTLGFGDITPNLNSNALLSCIIVQVILGALNIGLFLNSISNKITANKEEEIKEEARKKKLFLNENILKILKPIVKDQLRILSDIYRSTSTEVESKNFKISPGELWNDAYFDQVCLINYYSVQNKYKNGLMLLDIITNENDKFQSDLESYLLKFSYSLDIETIVLINDIQTHPYFTYTTLAKTLLRLNGNSNQPRFINSREHSDFKGVNTFPPHMRNFHGKLLELINLIDLHSPDDRLEMDINLKKNFAPPVGSAITGKMLQQ